MEHNTKTLCSNEQKIRFCGVINSMGKLVAGGFKDGIKPLDTEDQRRMLYMQSALELSMKDEFSNNLGAVNYITTYRDNLAIINIPMHRYGHLVLLSIERNAKIEQTVKNIVSLFESNNVFEVNKTDSKYNDENITPSSSFKSVQEIKR